MEAFASLPTMSSVEMLEMVKAMRARMVAKAKPAVEPAGEDPLPPSPAQPAPAAPSAQSFTMQEDAAYYEPPVDTTDGTVYAFEELLINPTPERFASYFHFRLPFQYLHTGSVWWYNRNGVWSEGKAAVPTSLMHALPRLIREDLAAYGPIAAGRLAAAVDDEAIIRTGLAQKNIPTVLKEIAKPALATSCGKYLVELYVESTSRVLAERDAPSVDDLMDRDPHLFAFSDAVFDFRAVGPNPDGSPNILGAFRRISPDLFISTTTGYPAPRAANPAVRADMIARLHSIWEDDFATYRYFIHAIAVCTHGERNWENFWVLTGGGGNGKGLIFELISAVFGDYYMPAPPAILSALIPDPSKPNAILASWRGKRLVVASEPPADAVIQEANVKAWTGGDDIIVKPPYKPVLTFKPQFGLFLQCNIIPKFSIITEALKRRLRIIEFKYLFRAVPTPGTNERPADPHLKNVLCRSREWRDEMALFLLEEAVIIRSRGPAPDAGWLSPTVAMTTENFFRNANPFGAWFNARYERDDTPYAPGVPGFALKTANVLAVYNAMHPTQKPMTRPDFEAALISNQLPVQVAPFAVPHLTILQGDQVIVGYRQRRPVSVARF